MQATAVALKSAILGRVSPFFSVLKKSIFFNREVLMLANLHFTVKP
jgi:hypothetical protein